tara:strand:- start:2438 stop:3907 length:1470 start_codon:yes stop_codon:yes gene_type:complete
MATIVTRSGKGSPLTNTEVDANFTNLNTGLTPIEGPSSLGSAGQVLTVNSGASASEWAAAAGGADLYTANESSPSNQPSATGANAVAIGDGAQATGSDSFALGENSRSGATRSTAFAFSNAGGTNSFAACIGSTSNAKGALSTNSVAMGKNATAGGLRSAALGDEAVTGTSGESAVALGTSYANGTDCFAAAISTNSTALGARDTNTIAMGEHCSSSQSNAVAIGSFNVASDYYSTIIGGFSSSVACSYAAILGGRDNTISNFSSQQTGDYSAILGGRDNTVNNNYSVAWGYSNAISGYASTGGGDNNTVSADYSFATGYYNLISSDADYCFAHGTQTRATVQGSRVQAAGRFSVDGDAQGGQYILRAATTDATATVLTSAFDLSSAVSASNVLSAFNNKCITFSGTIVAMQNGAQSYGSWDIKGLLVNDGGTTTLPSSAITVISNESNWGITLTADNTIDALFITVTGEASHNIRWVANIHTAEVTYA